MRVFPRCFVPSCEFEAGSGQFFCGYRNNEHLIFFVNGKTIKVLDKADLFHDTSIYTVQEIAFVWIIFPSASRPNVVSEMMPIHSLVVD